MEIVQLYVYSDELAVPASPDVPVFARRTRLSGVTRPARTASREPRVAPWTSSAKVAGSRAPRSPRACRAPGAPRFAALTPVFEVIAGHQQRSTPARPTRPACPPPSPRTSAVPRRGFLEVVLAGCVIPDQLGHRAKTGTSGEAGTASSSL